MKNGFSIIELVISIFLLSLAIVAIFTAFSFVTILTSDSADRLTASYLAQEGMEIVRNIRDQNWLNMDADCTSNQNCVNNNANSWLDGLADNPGNLVVKNNPINCDTFACEADYTSTAMAAYASTDYLYINTDGFYVYNPVGGVVSKFQRRIIIKPTTDVDNASEHIIKVIVQVSWNQKATLLLDSGISASDSFLDPDITKCNPKNCVTAEETLYNWYNATYH